MFGLLTVNKPIGMSSRQAVDAVKNSVRPAKIGHSGTLDPLASGVLVLCIGPATRLASFVQALPKTYIGEFQLGVGSASDDTETELVEVCGAPKICRNQLETVLPGFIGEIAQIPPKYSAVKIDGQRAYRMSRAGKSIDIKPRTISIHSIEILEFNYPFLKLLIECGSGTYIRSLGRDLGQKLDSGAVMTSLVRTAVGCFNIEKAIGPENISPTCVKTHLTDPIELFRDFDQVTLDDSQIVNLKNGHVFSRSELGTNFDARQIVATDRHGNLLAVLLRHKIDSYKPEINFAHHFLEIG